MNYTIRFCHLKERPSYHEGETITRGQKIGTMGNTGKSSAAHVHSDIVPGWVDKVYRLSDIYDMIKGHLPEICKQFFHFLDEELFAGMQPYITSHFGTIDYGIYDHNGKVTSWEFHPAYDFVPENRHREPGKNSDLYWNRSSDGVILKVGFDHAYGYYVNIGFKA